MNDDPEWLSESRTSVKFLRAHSLIANDYKWGCLTYRTVYTPESEERWGEAMKKLRSHVNNVFHFERHQDPSLSPTPDNLSAEKFGLLLQEDPDELKDASVDVIRAKFQSWVEQRDRADESLRAISTSVCLVIDQESLDSILRAPGATPNDPVSPYRTDIPWIKVIAQEYNESIAERGAYLGWTRCSAASLCELFGDLPGLEPFEIFPLIRYEGQIPFYKGLHANYLIDPPGGSEGRRFFGGTQRGPPKAATGGPQSGGTGGTQRGGAGGTQRGTAGGTQRGSAGGTQRGTAEGRQRGSDGGTQRSTGEGTPTSSEAADQEGIQADVPQGTPSSGHDEAPSLQSSGTKRGVEGGDQRGNKRSRTSD
ncbi:Hypothetical protein D9617_7g031760 [Elsinoe fawcettii]|nr:Hypothetical protein D9617_7g031760 [Elsinoe fawcettii]